MLLQENTVMTGQEISGWFGVNHKYYANHRKEFLEELKLYCDCDISRGKIQINKVYINQYIKGWNNEYDQLFRQYALNEQGQLLNQTAIANKIVSFNKDYNLSTLDYQLANSRSKAKLIAEYSTPDFYDYDWYQKLVTAINAKNKAKNNIRDGEASNSGIYGIYLNDELIYIGQTRVSFEERWKQHKKAIMSPYDPNNGMILYQYVNSLENINFKPLICLSDINTEDKLTRRDLDIMELTLITLYQPKYNIMGKSKPYKISHQYEPIT